MSSRGAAFRASFNASAYQRGEKLGITEEEAALYDAFGTNDSAVQALGDENLRFIAQELTKTIRENVTIDCDRARSRVAHAPRVLGSASRDRSCEVAGHGEA